MTTPHFFSPGKIHEPGSYSHGVAVSGRLLIVSGQVGLDAERNVVGAGDFAAQAIQAFENLLAVLAEGGASARDVVRLGVILASRDHLAKFRDIRGRYFSQPMPASTLIIAGLVLPELLVEVEAIAQLPG